MCVYVTHVSITRLVNEGKKKKERNIKESAREFLLFLLFKTIVNLYIVNMKMTGRCASDIAFIYFIIFFCFRRCYSYFIYCDKE